MITVTVDLNGSKVTHAIEPRENLADFLRERCGLTATHIGCEHGACGACTVVVDGQASRSCIMLAAMCDGRLVRTLEGLRADPVMELLRRHFHQSHALQCGFCTPGMLITSLVLLRENPRPTDGEIRAALSGNLCRCTGYQNIVRAVRLAARSVDGRL
jgi:aerobic carbon-monoxide dehydrogenase small subunit